MHKIIKLSPPKTMCPYMDNSKGKMLISSLLKLCANTIWPHKHQLREYITIGAGGAIAPTGIQNCYTQHVIL